MNIILMISFLTTNVLIINVNYYIIDYYYIFSIIYIFIIHIFYQNNVFLLQKTYT